MISHNKLPKAFIRELKALFRPTDLLLQENARWTYGYDNSRQHGIPDAVVFPEYHDEIKSLVQLCNLFQVPLIPRGRGTGTTGATVPLNGGVILSMERMERIMLIDPDNRLIIAEPGVTNQTLQNTVAPYGFFWPPDPTSAAFCSLGGNLAYNSAGPRAVKYGTTRENTLGLRAITGSGEEIRTGTQTTKGVVGYDLTRLLIGSEGTLAIITEATLKLTPLPESSQLLAVYFDSSETAALTISNIMAQPTTPCALEFMDAGCLQLLRQQQVHSLPHAIPEQAKALLYIELDGAKKALVEEVEKIMIIVQKEAPLVIHRAEKKAEKQKLWQLRKILSPTLRQIAPKKINEDVVVPVSRIPALLHGLAELAKQYQLKIVSFGHAGNGNLHVNLLINPDDPEQSAAAEHCLSDIFDIVLALNGTISGEHGIGLVKRDFVSREIDQASLKLMRQIKQQFDPLNILNPCKTIPPI